MVMKNKPEKEKVVSPKLDILPKTFETNNFILNFICKSFEY